MPLAGPGSAELLAGGGAEGEDGDEEDEDVAPGELGVSTRPLGLSEPPAAGDSLIDGTARAWAVGPAVGLSLPPPGTTSAAAAARPPPSSAS
ncbi:hypothetical protein GCM10010430_55010 [Kitasatospora cystarginea]|uniref:Uncharacterized protein n=1 Tax=Kitasatospora cystarginea TaxID=58350 RepID=A0ABN3EM94_9ACTN